MYFSFIKFTQHLAFFLLQHPMSHIKMATSLPSPTSPLTMSRRTSTALHSSLNSNMHAACPTATEVKSSHVAFPAPVVGQVTLAAFKASVTCSEVLTRKYLWSVSGKIIEPSILLLCSFLQCGIGSLRGNT